MTHLYNKLLILYIFAFFTLDYFTLSHLSWGMRMAQLIILYFTPVYATYHAL